MAESRFSQWLDRERQRAHLNYSGLASQINVGPNTARAWCIGESEPSPENVQALARVFRVDVLYLFEVLGWLPESSSEWTPDQRRVIAKLAQVPADRWADLEDQVDLILRRQ